LKQDYKVIKSSAFSKRYFNKNLKFKINVYNKFSLKYANVLSEKLKIKNGVFYNT